MTAESRLTVLQVARTVVVAVVSGVKKTWYREDGRFEIGQNDC